MCPSNLLSQQLQHAAILAVVVAILAAIACTLDLFATKIGQLGATDETVKELRKAGFTLFRLDLWFVIGCGIVQVVRALRCMTGL